MLAVGTHGFRIYLYSITAQAGKATNNYELLHTLDKHTSYITQIDFGVCVKHQGGSNGASSRGEQHIMYAQKYDNIKKKVVITQSKLTLDQIHMQEAAAALAASSSSSSSLPSNSKKSKSKGLGVHEIETIEQELTPDDIVMQSTCGGDELLFWRARSGEQIKSPAEVKDTWWATFTCSFGWPVQVQY